MAVTFQDYLIALREPIRYPVAKVEILNSSEQLIDIIPPEDIISGDVSLTFQNGSRRNASLVLDNIDGLYTPSYRGKLWIQKRLRIWAGLNIQNEDYLFSKGIFFLSEPQVNSYFSDRNVSLSLLDKWSFLDGTLGGKLGATYIIPLGTNIFDAVKAVLIAAGETKPPIVDPTSEVTPYTITQDSSGTYADLLITLANMISWNIYFDANGYLNLRQPIDDLTKSSDWDYATDEVTYLGSSHKYSFDKVRNKIYVIGDNINGSLVSESASDTNIFSPTRIDLIGERSETIVDTIIYTNVLAQDRANYELKKSIILQESVDEDSLIIPHLQEGDIVTILDTSNGLNRNKYTVQSINIPLLNQEKMTISAWKSRSIT
jgi:hypothetical protein